MSEYFVGEADPGNDSAHGRRYGRIESAPAHRDLRACGHIDLAEVPDRQRRFTEVDDGQPLIGGKVNESPSGIDRERRCCIQKSFCQREAHAQRFVRDVHEQQVAGLIPADFALVALVSTGRYGYYRGKYLIRVDHRFCWFDRRAAWPKLVLGCRGP